MAPVRRYFSVEIKIEDRTKKCGFWVNLRSCFLVNLWNCVCIFIIICIWDVYIYIYICICMYVIYVHIYMYICDICAYIYIYALYVRYVYGERTYVQLGDLVGDRGRLKRWNQHQHPMEPNFCRPCWHGLNGTLMWVKQEETIPNLNIKYGLYKTSNMGGLLWKHYKTIKYGWFLIFVALPKKLLKITSIVGKLKGSTDF